MDQPNVRRVAFEWTTRDDIRDFPPAARRQAGHDLNLVANGEEPSDWKPMPSVGPGVREIIIETHEHESELQHRVIYVTKFADAVYVLHAFPKKTRKTSQHDIDIAKRRLSELNEMQRRAK